MHTRLGGAIAPDLDNGLVVFVNLTRNDFCPWLAGGAVGIRLGSLVDWHIETGRDQDFVGIVGQGTLPLELSRLDDDAELTGACTDTDQSTEPFAVGEAEVMMNVMTQGAETDVMRGRGTVVDAAGNEYRYHFTGMSGVDGQDVLRRVDDFGLLVPLP